MSPTSRLALSVNPSVAYRALNLPALWKKQTTLPSLAYAGIPYQVFGASCGAVDVMILWRRSAILRSLGGISEILARQSASACALVPLAFRSLASSFIAAVSSAVKTVEPALREGFLSGISATSFNVLVAARPGRRVALAPRAGALRR